MQECKMGIEITVDIFFSKGSWEIYPSATDIWSFIDMTRRKPSKNLCSEFPRGKEVFEKKKFFFSKREEIQRTSETKSNVGKQSL